MVAAGILELIVLEIAPYPSLSCLKATTTYVGLRQAGIQGHPYCIGVSTQQKSRTDCCHNVNQCRHYFWNLRRYSIGKTASNSST